MTSFLQSQTDKYRYQNFLKSTIYLGLQGFPLNTELSDTSLKYIQDELRNRGYKQEDITQWFNEIKNKYQSDDKILGVNVDGEQVFIFLSELPLFKNQLWLYHYGKINLKNYVQFIADKTLLDIKRQERNEKLSEESLYMANLLTLVDETDILEEFISQQLYAQGVHDEQLKKLKQEIIEEIEN